MNYANTEVIITNRTANDGSMIYFNPYKPRTTMDQIDSAINLTDAQRQTVEAILELEGAVDDERTIATSQIKDHLSLSESTLKQRILSLSRINLLQPVPFRYSDGGSPRRCKLWELVVNNNTIAAKTQKDYEQQIQGRSVRADQIKNSPEYRHEFYDVNVVDAPNTRLVTPKNNYIYEQLIDVSSSDRKQLVKPFSVQGRTVHALVKSHSRIVNMDDFKIYCALVTLVYHYHQYVTTTYKDFSVPKNRTPIHIDDILKLIYPHRNNRRFSGKDTRRVREAFKAIDDTSFEIIDQLIERVLNIEAIGFTKRTSRLVKQLTPFTTQRSEIDGDQLRFGENATIYIVELNDNVFDALLTDATLFVLPRSVLGLPPVLFGLYLKLRGLTHIPKDKLPFKIALPLALVQQSLCSHISFDQFKRSLDTELRLTKRVKTIDELTMVDTDSVKEQILFQLFGYHVVWDQRNDELNVHVNVEEFLQCCDITKKSQRAPTTRNKLRDAVSPIFALQSSLVRKVPDSLPFPVKVNKYHIDFFVNGQDEAPLQLSVYDDSHRFVERLKGFTSFDAESLLIYLDSKKQTLRELTVSGRLISSDDMNFIDDALLNRYELSQLVLMLARKLTLHDGLLQLLSTGEVPVEWLATIEQILPEKDG